MKIVRGEAQAVANDSSVRAAPVCLVAFNVAKDATAEQFKDFVVTKGLDILDCELITTFQGARTNSFKVTVLVQKIMRNL